MEELKNLIEVMREKDLSVSELIKIIENQDRKSLNVNYLGYPDNNNGHKLNNCNHKFVTDGQIC